MVLIMAALALCAFYWFPVRRWFACWGAGDSDVARAMPGDACVSRPTYQATLAVTIAARPEHIWPWLLQMGYRRGGLYSYDWLDRLFGYLDRPSATEVLPEFQSLSAGEEIPIGRAGGFPIKAVEPHRALVLAGAGDGFAWVWQFGIYPLDAAHTTLVVPQPRSHAADRRLVVVHARHRTGGVPDDQAHAARAESTGRDACGHRASAVAARGMSGGLGWRSRAAGLLVMLALSAPSGAQPRPPDVDALLARRYGASPLGVFAQIRAYW